MTVRLRPLRALLPSLLLALLASSADAQFVITQYRVTRTATGQTPSTYTFQKSSMTCNVPLASVPTTGPMVSFTDEANPANYCYLATAGNWADLPAGVAFSFTVAAAQANGVFSPESAPYVTGRPGAPTNFGLRPTFTGIALNGTVLQRGPFAGIDVATSRLDDNGVMAHLGMATLSIPGFEIRPGDRFQVAFWR